MKRITRYQPELVGTVTGAAVEMTETPSGDWVMFDDVPSWDMLMDILDAVYPASVFTGVSGDPGPRIIVKLREIDAIRREGSGKTEKFNGHR